MGDSKKYITAEELKKHNKKEDLWISVQGKVYNVTDWIKQHPGGDIPILNLAGQEATDAFIAFHPEDYEVLRYPEITENFVLSLLKLDCLKKRVKGHGVIYSFCFIAFLLFLTFYGVLFSSSFLIHMLSGALLGLTWMQISYLGHDSGHYVIMTTRGFNKMIQILSGNCLTGISIAWWKWTHNAHHVACNSLDYDPDLQHLPVFVVSSSLSHSIPWQNSFSAISILHFTFYPIICISRLNLFLQTLLLLFSRRKVPDRFLNILGILVFWTWFPLLVSTLPNWTERMLFLLTSFSVTGIQHVQFCLNHFTADVYVGQPKGNDWFEKQTAGTIDIACSPQMDWFFGGLQFQLEHHLFPRLPRCQLRKISLIVQELCKKHNLPYRSLSFYEANKWTIRTLKVAAMQARGLLWKPLTLTANNFFH
ncbi:unnamed protein product [Withania somnifera]